MTDKPTRRTVTRATIVPFIEQLFNDMGDMSYLGEDISQAEHGLQCALLADQCGSADSLVAAALLHDIGHFLHDLGVDCHEDDIDNRHEQVGADFLKPFFPEPVTEPIRMHVDAKRYLCAVEGDYFNCLTPASVHSLDLQGGPMSAAEVAAFRQAPYLEDALQLRRFEDGGKSVGVQTPPVESYRDLLKRVQRPQADAY